MIAIFPVLYNLDEYPWLHVHSKVKQAGQVAGFEVLDLLATYQARDEKSVRLTWGDYIHPNAQGHRVAGDALYEFLIEQGLVPVPRPSKASLRIVP